MRRFVLVLTLVFASRFACAQMDTLPQQTLDCVKVLLAQERAWNAGDINGFLSGYKNSPDLLFIGRSVQHGFDAVAENYRKTYLTRGQMGALEFSEFEVKPLGEIYAVVTGRFRLERKKQDGGSADGIFSVVMEKTDAGWKIIVDHTTD